MAKKEIIKEENENLKETNEKEKTLTKNQKGKKIIQICLIAVLLIVVFVVVFILTGGYKVSLEDKLSKSLTNMGKEFYTDFYYKEISANKTSAEISDFLSKYKDVGIKINLDNLSRYNEEDNENKIKEFKNEDGKECNKTNTKAIIYPKSPYGEKDFTIEVELDCGFKTEEK